jgi:hypothetical protein
MSDVQDHMIYSPDTVWSSDGEPLFVTEPSLRRLPSLFPDLLSFQWVNRRINAVRRRAASTIAGASVRDVDRYAWTLDQGPDLDGEAQNAMAPIALLSSLLRHNGIPLLLATYPQPWQVSAEATPLPPIREQYGIGLHTVHLNDRAFRKIERFSREQGIPFLNATQAFRKDATPESLFLGNDFHFSRRGNDLYAHELTNAIAEHGFMPR